MMAKMNYILERVFISRRLVSIRNDGASIQPGRACERAKAVLAVTYGELTRLDAFEPLRRAVAPKMERVSTSETRPQRDLCRARRGREYGGPALARPPRRRTPHIGGRAA
jgi:hypothetical protein